MSRRRIDLAWDVVSITVAEILNPLLLITSALFVSVGYILTLLMPVNIDIWAALLLMCILIPLALLTLRARRLWRQRQVEAECFSWRNLLPFVPLLLFLPPAIAVLALPSLESIAHIDLYFPYILQAYISDTPIENILVAGFPANHYWLFYAFNAAIIRLSHLDIYTAFVVVNIAFILASLFWISLTLVELGIARSRTIWLGIMVLFVFSSVNVSGILAVLSHTIDGVGEPGKLALMLLEGADRRLHSVVPKVFHASGMTPGIVAFTATVYILVRILRGNLELNLLALVSAAAIVALAVMPIAAVFIAGALFGGLVLTVAVEMAKASKRWEWVSDSASAILARISSGTLLIWLLVSLGLALPLLNYIDVFTDNYQ